MSDILALDWGRKKTGYATSDSMGIAITPRDRFYRDPKIKKTWTLSKNDQVQINNLLDKYESQHILLGLPLNADGSESEASQGARELAKEIEMKFSIKVSLINEVLSSWNSKGSDNVDAEAAATLIKDYFEQKKRKEKKREGFFKISLLVFLGLAFLSFFAISQFKSYWNEQVLAHQAADSFIVEIKEGDTLYKLNEDFHKLGIHFKKWPLKIWLRLYSKNKTLRKGEFALNPEWTRHQVLKHLLFGQSHLRFFTHKEGNNIWELRDTLKAKLVDFDEELYWKTIKNTSLIKSIVGISTPPETKTLEGFLFPETYSFEKLDNSETVLKNMLSHFKKSVKDTLEKHPWAQTPYGLYKLVTLASVIEKESGNFEEQPTISSVFWNRIEKGMRLQSDPTTIYALLPNFDGNLKRIHLNEKTDYNTYQIKFPIGPIANPGASALQAVVSPKKTPFLFFVSKGNGHHVFSETYEQHKQYVRQYQLRR